MCLNTHKKARGWLVFPEGGGKGRCRSVRATTPGSKKSLFTAGLYRNWFLLLLPRFPRKRGQHCQLIFGAGLLKNIYIYSPRIKSRSGRSTLMQTFEALYGQWQCRKGTGKGRQTHISSAAPLQKKCISVMMPVDPRKGTHGAKADKLVLPKKLYILP